MAICDICGKELTKKNCMQGYVLCSKHMHQLFKQGKFLDNIQRTNKDLNDYKILDNQTVKFNLYNQRNEYIDSFSIDLEDIEKVKYHKWRKSHNHVVTGQPNLGRQRELSHIILGLSKEDIQEKKIVVDHIDGNPLNNKKNNLRICSQKENILNKSFMSNNTSGFIGVSYKKDRGTYDPEIRIDKKRCHLGSCKIFEEAVYERYYAEQLLFKEFANQQEQERKKEFCKNLSLERKKELEQHVITKLQQKEMLRQ